MFLVSFLCLVLKVASKQVGWASAHRRTSPPSAASTSAARFAAQPSGEMPSSHPTAAPRPRSAPAPPPPTLRIHPQRHAPAEAGKRPIPRMPRKSVLHRIEMDVIHVNGMIPIVADRVLPIPALPNPSLALADQRSAPPLHA